MKNAIITCTDNNFVEFVSEHWLKSLKENVDLTNIDIIILSYNLSKNNILKLEKHAKVIPCINNGHIAVIRYRDLATFLKNNIYDQIMFVDGGDILFQENISEIFQENKQSYRAVCEDLEPPFTMYVNKWFNKEDANKIKHFLKGKKMINGGMLVASHEMFRNLCQKCNSMIKEKCFGPDQLAVNYIIHNSNFKELPAKYNFVLTTAKHPFKIKKGKFYLHENELIPIVHNAGGKSFFRPVKNFGYGEKCNKFRPIRYYVLRITYKSITELREMYKRINYFFKV
ncbi:MAG: glycosyl transferase family 8 [Candidatus Woesearchaeota archaeon]|jgi:hypothetical protein